MGALRGWYRPDGVAPARWRWITRATLLLAFACLFPATPASALVVENLPVGSPPSGMAIDPATHDVYVAQASGRLTVISGDTHTVTGTIDVGEAATAVGVDPLTHTAYVAHQFQASLSVVNEITKKVTATIPVGVFPWSVAVDPRHRVVYVTNAASQTISVIDAATNTVTATIKTSAYPFGVAVDPTTRNVYVADGAPNAVSVIDGATNKVTATIRLDQNSGPVACAVDPSTHTLYVVNQSAGTVSVIDEDTNQVTGTISVGRSPEGVTVDPDSHTVYVTNRGSNTLSIINASTRTVTSTVPVQSAPSGVAVEPAESTAYVANTDSNSVSIVSPTEASIPAIGVPIDTISGPDGQVRIGNQTYGSGALRLVAVNRKTLEVRAFSFANDAAAFPEVRSKIDEFDDNWLDIVTAPDGLKHPTDPKAFNNTVVAAIGGAPLPDVVAGGGLPLSVIGVRGWKSGAAYENPAGLVALGPMRNWVCAPTKRRRKPPRGCTHGRGAVSGPGALIGYLQLNPASQALGFAFGDFPSFDTRATSTPDSVVIQVAGRRFELSLPSGQSGFGVVYLDRWSLRGTAGVFATNTGDARHDAAEQEALGQSLQRTSDQQLVVVQSIGTPRPTTMGWNEIAAGITKVGGSESLVNSLDGKNSYGLITVPGIAGDASESMSDATTEQDGSVIGVLARDHSAGYAPLLSDPTGREPTNLLQLAYQQPSQWPDRDSIGKRAAIRYISQRLDLHVDDPRLAYTDLTIDFGGATYYGTLKDLPYPGGSVTFSADDFAAVKAELLREFFWVSKVRDYAAGIRQALDESVVIKQGQLQQIANTIKDKSGAGGKLTTVNAFDLYSNVFVIGKALAPDPRASAAAGAAVMAMKIAGALTQKDGVDVLGRLTASTDNLAADLVGRYVDALTSLDVMQAILVTDHNKLEIAGTNINDGKPGWTWDLKTRAGALRDLELAAKRLFNETLLKTVYVTYTLDPDFQNAPDCRVLAGEPRSAWISHINAFSGPAGNVRPVTQAWAIGTRQEDDRYGRMKANADLIDPLFQKISPDTTDRLGLSKAAFISGTLERQGLRVRYCHPLLRPRPNGNG